MNNAVWYLVGETDATALQLFALLGLFRERFVLCGGRLLEFRVLALCVANDRLPFGDCWVVFVVAIKRLLFLLMLKLQLLENSNESALRVAYLFDSVFVAAKFDDVSFKNLKHSTLLAIGSNLLLLRLHHLPKVEFVSVLTDRKRWRRKEAD